MFWTVFFFCKALISILICETGAAAETFDLYVDDGDAGTDHYIYKSQAIGANETFEHTTKIVIEDTDMLGMIASSGDLDVVVSSSYLLEAKDFIRMATFAWPVALLIIIAMIFYWVGLGLQPLEYVPPETLGG